MKGDPSDAHVTTSGGAMLAGGAYDRATAWRWFIAKAGYGDILIIRATGEDDYQPYVWKLGTVNSVQTLKLTKRIATTDPFVLRSIEEADGIFIAGGDQSDYVRIWKDSPVEEAINAAVARDVPIGGISAGLAVQGEFSFSAEKGTAVSDHVLRDPFSNKVRLQRDFLRVPHLGDTITDSHFMARDRMGRLVTFMARIVTDGWSSSVRGVGVDEYTAVLMDADGSASVVGPGAAWFLRLDANEVRRCVPGEPLTTGPIEVLEVQRGDEVDLTTFTGTGTQHSVRAHDGSLTWGS
jgi:cyanophycinase